MSTETEPFQYPENSIEAVLAYPDKQRAMESLLCVAQSPLPLGGGPRTIRFCVLGTVYWSTNWSGFRHAVENIGEELREAVLMLREIEAVKTAAVLEETLALFPADPFPNLHEMMDATDSVCLSDPEIFERLGDRFLKSFSEEEDVLLRLHGWVSANRAWFPPMQQTPKGKWVVVRK